jgi:hypothetical protein
LSWRKIWPRNASHPIRSSLPRSSVDTLGDLGWAGQKDHVLITKIEGRYDVFLTIDKGFEFEHDLKNITLDGYDSVQFVAGRRRVSATRALQESLRLRHIAPCSAPTEILFGPQGRYFLGHRDVDELVECHAFGFRNASRLFQY